MEKKCVKELNTDYGKSYNGYKFILPVAGELVFLFFMFFMARLMDPSLERTWFHDAVSEGLIYGSVLAILLGYCRIFSVHSYTLLSSRKRLRYKC